MNISGIENYQNSEFYNCCFSSYNKLYYVNFILTKLLFKKTSTVYE